MLFLLSWSFQVCFWSFASQTERMNDRLISKLIFTSTDWSLDHCSLGSKTGITNGVKACGRLQWMSAHQTRPCSRRWTKSCSWPQYSRPCSHSCSRPQCSCPCSHSYSRPCSHSWNRPQCRCPCSLLCNRPCSHSCSFPQCNRLCSLPLRFTSPLQFCDNMVAICCSDKWLHV